MTIETLTAEPCDHKFIDSNVCVRPGCGKSIQSLKAEAYNEALELIAATMREANALVKERDQLRTELGQSSAELRAKAEEAERLKDERDEAESAARQADESKLTERKERIRTGKQLAAANALLDGFRARYSALPAIPSAAEWKALGVETMAAIEQWPKDEGGNYDAHLSGQPAPPDYRTVRVTPEGMHTPQTFTTVANQPAAPSDGMVEVTDARGRKHRVHPNFAEAYRQNPGLWESCLDEPAPDPRDAEIARLRESLRIEREEHQRTISNKAAEAVRFKDHARASGAEVDRLKEALAAAERDASIAGKMARELKVAEQKLAEAERQAKIDARGEADEYRARVAAEARVRKLEAENERTREDWRALKECVAKALEIADENGVITTSRHKRMAEALRDGK